MALSKKPNLNSRFISFQGVAALAKVEEMVITLLNPQQQEYLKEVGTYLQSESGAWAIGEEHIELLVYLLRYVKHDTHLFRWLIFFLFTCFT